MAAPAKPRSFFGEQLRAQLDRHPEITSVRKLSRVMADGNEKKAETYRRLLGKWIAGAKPTVASRYVVAQALGVDASEFSDGEDDEEEAELADLIRALMHQVGVVVDRKLEERLNERKPQHA